MILRERIIKLLLDSSKTMKFLRENLPDKHARNIAATISNNKDVFLRLEKGLVGLRDRDEDKVTGKPITSGDYALYMKMVNILTTGEKTIEEMYRALPQEKRVSIRATVNMRPELFIRIAKGVIGRAGRDEHLIERYRIARDSIKMYRDEGETIVEKLEFHLKMGAKSLAELDELIADYPKASLSAKLSQSPKFESRDGKWVLL